MQYRDRRNAGRQLGRELSRRTDLRSALILALPRGGVPVAAEVAAALGAPLDLLLVHKVGVPWQPELAMGAVGEGGLELIDAAMVRRAGVSPDTLNTLIHKESAALAEQRRRLLGDLPRQSLSQRTVVIVDDGAATGATAVVACRCAAAAGADRILVAVPVASAEAVEALRPATDEVVCPLVPRSFTAVGQWYRDFTQVTDAQVLELLAKYG